MWQTLNNKIRKAFTEAADQYDILASLHREIGRELVQKIIHLAKVTHILDVGCGTGYLTAKAKFYFPESDVTGMDFSEGMLAKAKEKDESIHWICGDAHRLPFKDESMDVVISNLAYQWVLDLSQAFQEVHRVLDKKGVLAATLFGFYTCEELFASLQAVGVAGPLNRLPLMEEIEGSLKQAGFGQSHVDYERIHIQFKDLWEVLTWLKAIGANVLSNGAFVGATSLEKANAYCLKNYPYHNGIRITFEIIWINAHA